MPYHGIIVLFKLIRFARLEISTSVINTIITGEKLLFLPPPNEHQELENICKQIEHTPINIRKSKDNLKVQSCKLHIQITNM